MAIAVNDQTGEVLIFDGKAWVTPPMADNPDTGESVYFDGSGWIPMPTPISKESTVTPSTALPSEKPAKDRPETPMEKTIRELEAKKAETGSLNFFENVALRKAQESQAQMGSGKILGKVAQETILGIPKVGMLATEILAPETATAIQESDIGKYVSSVLDKIDPKFDTPEEELVADLATYLTIGGAARKIGVDVTEALLKRYGKKKAEGLVEKLQKVAPEAVGTTSAAASVPLVDVQLRDDANQQTLSTLFTPEMQTLYQDMKESPEKYENVGGMERFILDKASSIYDTLNETDLGREVIDLSKRLEINPNDPIDLKRKKQLEESIIVNGSLGAATGGALLLLKYGTKGLTKVTKSLIDNIKKPIKEANEVLPKGETSTVIASVPEPKSGPNKVANDNVGLIPRGENDNLGRSISEEAASNLEAGAPRIANDNLNVSPNRLANDNLGRPTGTGVAEDTLGTPTSRGAVQRLDEGISREANDNLNVAPTEAVNNNFGPPTPPNTPTGVRPPPPNPPTGGTQRSFIAEKLATINTGLGRLFTSRAALPEKLFQALENGDNNLRSVLFQLKKDIRDVRKLQKKDNVPDEVINDYLAGRPTTISRELTPVLDRIKTDITNNENKINDLLGLSGDNRIGLSLDQGEVYLTRFYEASYNPSYVKRITKALYGKSANADSLSRIENARTYFKNLISREADETLDAYNNHIDGVIETVVSNVAKQDEGILKDIFSGVDFRGNARGTPVKSLKARQDIAPEIRSLLGEVRNPVDRIATTLATQRKIITRLEMLRKIEQFAGENMNRPVKLPGLIPFLPSKVTTFKPKEGLGVTSNLEDYAQKIIGSLGGNTTNILRDVFTSPQLARYIDEGLEVFMPNRQGAALVDFLGKASSFYQAKQTLFNLPGYLMQVWGNLQTLLANGYFFSLVNLPKAVVKDIITFGKQVTLKDPVAIARLDKLIEAGILQSDTTGSIITRGANLYGKEPRNLFSKIYNKTMSTLGTIYSIPDSYTKMVMVTLEEKALKKSFPRLTDDKIFDMAVDRVKDTAATYGRAAPALRALSRLPVSNYPLFSGEMIRIHKNIAMLGLKDLVAGATTGNFPLFVHGVKRTGGFLASLGGAGLAVDINNDAKKITENQKQIINLLSPEWNKGSINLYLEPFVLDKTKGQNYIRTRFVSSGYLDQMDAIKGVFRLALANVLKTGNLSPTELEKNLEYALETATSPYTSPKFLTESGIAVVSGVDPKTGKPIYDQAAGATVADKIVSAVKELTKGATPATQKVISEYLESLKSEERLGEGLGERANGFPMNSQDYKTLLTTGIRPTTVNVTKAIGFDLFKDLKAINQLDANFYDFLRKDVATVPYSKDIENSIIEKYKELQDRKLKATQDLAKKVNLFSNMDYIEKTKEKPEGVKKKFGTVGVYRSVTNDGTFNADPEILYALKNAKNSLDKGMFIPDMYAGEAKLRDSLLSKHYTIKEIIQVNKALNQASLEYIKNNKRSLKDK